MKTLKYLFITCLVFSFVACATKSEQDVSKSNKKEISKLLVTLIEKEKEIIKLSQDLEDCKNK